MRDSCLLCEKRERDSSEEESESESYALFPLPDSEETFGNKTYISHLFLGMTEMFVTSSGVGLYVQKIPNILKG